MSESPTPKLRSIPDTAAILGISKRSVYNLLTRQALESRRIGRRRLITSESIEALAERGTDATEAA